jgi:hypothetical protein
MSLPSNDALYVRFIVTARGPEGSLDTLERLNIREQRQRTCQLRFNSRTFAERTRWNSARRSPARSGSSE